MIIFWISDTVREMEETWRVDALDDEIILFDPTLDK